MGAQDPREVDAYLEAVLARADPVLNEVLAANAAAALPPEDVSPLQGRLLTVLAAATGASRVLELGTLGGYSTICLARGLPAGGRLLSLELDPARAEVARENVVRAGLGELVEIRIGAALELLPELSGEAPFDLVFIDADKARHAEYVEWAVRLARPGTLIFADNVVRDGAVADGSSTDPRVLGVQRMFDRLGSDPRLEATAIQTVGAKGWDGFALAVVGPED